MLIATVGTLPPELSSALGFSAAGLIAGLCTLAWASSRHAHAEDVEPDDRWQEPGAGIAWTPDDTPQPARVVAPEPRGVLPVLVVSVGSLVAAAAVAPSQVALALLAVGLLGIALIPILRNHERRLAALERRFRQREPD
jgi:hypothetical protein